MQPGKAGPRPHILVTYRAIDTAQTEKNVDKHEFAFKKFIFVELMEIVQGISLRILCSTFQLILEVYIQSVSHYRHTCGETQGSRPELLAPNLLFSRGCFLSVLEMQQTAFGQEIPFSRYRQFCDTMPFWRPLEFLQYLPEPDFMT